MVEFRPYAKIPRLNRDIIITEKIDGTNAAVVITDEGEVLAQSRTRFITPKEDNFGFDGSVAAPGFMDPEGIVVWHTAARHGFKVTLKGDEQPKGRAA